MQRFLRKALGTVPQQAFNFANAFPHGALRRENAAVVASVAALHVLFLWLMIFSLRMPHARVDDREMNVTLTPADRHETAIPLPRSVPVASIPEVAVVDDEPQSTIAAAPAALVLAPRPDPQRINLPPTLAAVGASAQQDPLRVVLRILVLVDGTVARAQVVASSRQSDADAAAIGYVKANWRFIPAELNGAAIEYWTTVSVPFKNEE